MYQIKKLKYKNILDIKELNIDKDCITYITGESGSGKSTLLGFLNASSYKFNGNIYFHGEDIKKINSDIIRSKVGYLSQSHTFFKTIIIEEFEYIAKLLKIDYTSADISKLLKICCLELETSNQIDTLSGGEKQRLALARLLFTKKAVLILDEPTSALDEKTSQAVIQNIKEYTKNRVKLIIVTHNAMVINKQEDQVINLKKGKTYYGN